VKRDLVGALRLLVVPTLALAAIATFAPGRLGLAVRIYALVLSAVVLGLALFALRRSYPRTQPLRKSASHGDRGRRPPLTLVRLEHEAALGVAGAFDFHHRLRPHLRELAFGLLSTRRGISPDADPDLVGAILGEDTWDVVRKDRPPPEDRLARGLPLPELRRVVESLERI